MKCQFVSGECAASHVFRDKSMKFFASRQSKCVRCDKEDKIWKVQD